MSQEKVERNKELKQNRKKIVKKNKRKHVVATVLGTLVAIVLVCWLAYSGVQQYTNYREANPVSTEIDLSPISGFSLDDTDTEE